MRLPDEDWIEAVIRVHAPPVAAQVIARRLTAPSRPSRTPQWAAFAGWLEGTVAMLLARSGADAATVEAIGAQITARRREVEGR